MTFWRGVFALLIAVWLGGCETERKGLDFSGMMQRVGPPAAGRSRIVVLREKGYAGIGDAGWDVKLDGGPMADLKTGTYVYLDRPAGQHQLSATAAMFPGTSQREFSTQAGRTYFFLARPSERSKVLGGMAMAGGVAGLLVGAAVTSNNSNPGPLDFFPLEEDAARTTIAELRLAP
ncbi:DUF2846 domain-containing protein [Bradyrhizobium sp. CNPSo 4016]|nr:DUF2846 domain-containing protein [Bradyrhizobium glycinis]